MIDKLVFYFQYPFVRYALIVGVLIGEYPKVCVNLQTDVR